MDFKFFLFVTFSTCLSASFQSSNDEGKILSPSTDPSSTTIERYKQVKEIIFKAFLANLEQSRKDPGGNRRFTTLENRLTSSIFDIEVGEILRTMLVDDSAYFIVFYWYNIWSRSSIIPNITPICPLFAKEIIKLVFKNFKDFVYERFFKRDFCWTDPEAIKESYSLFHTLQIFWYNKLEPLGRKCLSPSEFANERESIEERFCFINTFLTNDPKDQIVREFRRLRQDMLIGRDKAIPTIKNFDLLVRYFVRQFKILPSTKFLEEFEWLASQSPSFLNYFVYFASWQRVKPPSFTHSLFRGFKASTRYRIRLEGKTSIIFGRQIRASDAEMAEAIRIARIITNKMEK